jgi:outer membrane receptor protein involved in Fe transport
MKNWLLSASALAGGMLLATNALAQTAPEAQATPDATAPARTDIPTASTEPEDSTTRSGEEIVVTGSRIRTPNEVSAVPITTISVQQLTQTARTSIGDALNDLPQLQSTYSQSNSTRFLGTGALNLLDLRGLGTSRTLVLVNGRRHVGADILNNAVSVDVNTIPTDLVERVDIVTGGNSAVYGSDAIAGVVNFVMKDKFEGLQLRAQGGVSDKGDAGSYFISGTAGKNFADGRGNIAVNAEYTHSEDLFGSDRKSYRRRDGFVTTNVDAAGAGVNGNLNFDGRPDATFFRDLRLGTISDGGLVAFPGAAPGANTAARCGRDGLGRAFTCNYLFQPGGTIAAQTGSAIGVAQGTATAPAASPAGVSYVGGNGNTGREGVLLQLLPRLDRYAANISRCRRRSCPSSRRSTCERVRFRSAARGRPSTPAARSTAPTSARVWTIRS